MTFGTAEQGVVAPATAIAVPPPPEKKRATPKALAEALKTGLLGGLSFLVKSTTDGAFNRKSYRLVKGAAISVTLTDDKVEFTAGYIMEMIYGSETERRNFTFESDGPGSAQALHKWALLDEADRNHSDLRNVKLFTPFDFLDKLRLQELGQVAEDALRRNLFAELTFYVRPNTGQLSGSPVRTTMKSFPLTQLTGVKVTSGWVAFILDGIPHRTDSLPSFEAFIAWMLSSPAAQRLPFSSHKDDKGLCGPAKAVLKIPFGVVAIEKN